jgi:hypothetical protein
MRIAKAGQSIFGPWGMTSGRGLGEFCQINLSILAQIGPALAKVDKFGQKWAKKYVRIGPTWT